MTLDELAALEALHARVAQGPWATDPAHMDLLIRPGEGHVPVADCGFAHNYPGRTHAQDRANAALIVAARNALPGLLALARRALEHERTATGPEMRAVAAALCEEVGDAPPASADRVERLLWRVACHACAERIAAARVQATSLMPALSGGAAP